MTEETKRKWFLEVRDGMARIFERETLADANARAVMTSTDDVEDYLNALEQRVVEAERLLQDAHDRMDDDNARVARNAYCRWCRGAGYDGTGLIHDNDCILVRIRMYRNPAPEGEM